MENPWKDLKKTNNEFIAECDKYYIPELNSKLKGKHKLRLEGYPGPYTGDPINSIIWLLASNPGHCEGEEKIYRNYEELFIRNLFHTNTQWPFFTFCPELRNTPGGVWWTQKLKNFINETGFETVSKYVFNAEYFPYHSEEYKSINLILPSQKYTFFLVNNAIKTGKNIILMRSENEWYNAVPELRNYKNKTVLFNIRRSWISPGNMETKFWNKIIMELKRKNNGT